MCRASSRDYGLVVEMMCVGLVVEIMASRDDVCRGSSRASSRDDVWHKGLLLSCAVFSLILA